MLQLEADRPQTFTTILPGATAARVVYARPAASGVRRELYAGRPSVRLSRTRAASMSLSDALRAADEVAQLETHEMKLNAATGAFTAQLVVPRVEVLDVLAQLQPNGPWAPMLRFAVAPQSQTMLPGPPTVYEVPEPNERDQGMHLVRVERQLKCKPCPAIDCKKTAPQP